MDITGDNATQETILLAIEIAVAAIVCLLAWLAVKYKDHPFMVKIGVSKIVNALNFLNTTAKDTIKEKVLEELKTREVRIDFIEKHLTIEQVREFRQKVNSLTDDKVAELTILANSGDIGKIEVVLQEIK